jgi:hypothetical protein
MIRECQICNKSFKTKPAHVRKGWGRFCSIKCFGKWHSKNLIGRKNPSWKDGEIKKRKCRICKKVFYIKRSRIKYGGGKYCSYDCRGLAERFEKFNNSLQKLSYKIR